MFSLKNYGRITLSSDINSSNLNMPLKKVKLLIYKNLLINKKNPNLYFKVPHPLTLSSTLKKDIPGDDPVLPPDTPLHIVSPLGVAIPFTLPAWNCCQILTQFSQRSWPLHLQSQIRQCLHDQCEWPCCSVSMET